MTIDMSKVAVTQRLNKLATLLNERGFVDKCVDMSSAAITTRLETLGSLSDMCRHLAQCTEKKTPPGVGTNGVVTIRSDL